jgi:hypothetical protein
MKVCKHEFELRQPVLDYQINIYIYIYIYIVYSWKYIIAEVIIQM